MSKKHKNLQPWLDYFGMLQSYEEKRFLEVDAEKHEAYITLPALFTLAGYDEMGSVHAGRSLREIWQLGRTVVSAIRSIRTYAGWKSQHGGSYLDRSFAIHVVKDEAPHDLDRTFLITSRRRWWKLWMWHDSIEVIEYTTKGQSYDRT